MSRVLNTIHKKVIELQVKCMICKTKLRDKYSVDWYGYHFEHSSCPECHIMYTKPSYPWRLFYNDSEGMSKKWCLVIESGKTKYVVYINGNVYKPSNYIEYGSTWHDGDMRHRDTEYSCYKLNEPIGRIDIGETTSL